MAQRRLDKKAAMPAAAAALAALTCASVQAEPPPPAGPWSGSFSAGLLKTTGTTDSSSFNAKGDLDWKRDPWENDANGQVSYASSSHQTNADSYVFGDKLSLNVNSTDYTFASLNYTNDHFAGVAEDFSEAAGYGRHFIKSDVQTLDADVGVGASEQRQADFHHYRSQFIGVFNFAYLWNITKQSHFKQTLHIEGGEHDTYFNPITELKLDIWGDIFATLAYEVRYNTEVPPESVHTNTIASVNFGYSFGKKP